jgi:hypothetical protein
MRMPAKQGISIRWYNSVIIRTSWYIVNFVIADDHTIRIRNKNTCNLLAVISQSIHVITLMILEVPVDHIRGLTSSRDIRVGTLMSCQWISCDLLPDTLRCHQLTQSHFDQF